MDCEAPAEDVATLRRRTEDMLAECRAWPGESFGKTLGEADCLIELEILEEEAMREFKTGATRDAEQGKLDYEGFLSPIALRRFAEYMNKNRQMQDGSVRDSDNWQRGIPLDVYVKSCWRHFHDWWTLHRGYEATDLNGNQMDLEESLCAVLFNVQGYLHELLKAKAKAAVPQGGTALPDKDHGPMDRDDAAARSLYRLKRRVARFVNRQYGRCSCGHCDNS